MKCRLFRASHGTIAPWVLTAIAFCMAPVLAVTPAARAEHYAVLMGIRDYTAVPPLFGPVNDVQALYGMLVERYGFPKRNVVLLTDERATRSAILSALSRLKDSVKRDDFVFVFFSGHGTSGYDPSPAGPALGEATGALVPYDFRPDEKDLRKTLEGLVIGRRDLRPIFTDLDRRTSVFVVFDACFSGNAVRAIGRRHGVPKNVSLGFPDFKPRFGGSEKEKEPYPYERLIYIAASDETERAIDLRAGAAYDGKAHGALTDALLVGLAGGADTNHDGTITYEELYQFVRRKVQVHGHTPQILHRSALSRPVFEKPVKVSAYSPPPPGPARLKIEGLDRHALAGALQGIPGLEMVEERPDLVLEGQIEGEGKPLSAVLYLGSGDKVCDVTGLEDTLSTLRKYAKARELACLRNPKQGFNLWLRVGGYEGKTTFFAGEPVGFTIRSEKDAYLLLLNIDPHGNVIVLLPEKASSWVPIRKGEALELKDYGRVDPPYGVEFLKLFGFPQRPERLDGLVRTWELTEEGQVASLLERIGGYEGWAETVAQVVTFGGP